MPGKIQNPIRSLGVLTGGGDVPGLNAAIKALAYRAETMGVHLMGLREGWKGITYLNRSQSLESQSSCSYCSVETSFSIMSISSSLGAISCCVC